MSLLVVGLSYLSAPIALLERTALDGAGARELSAAVCACGAASETFVLATCNRLEVYAEVESFHPALAALSAAISRTTGVDLAELSPALRFHHGDAAVERLFTVTAGLDSMALGEAQVMGQVRVALRRGQEDGTLGRVLDPLVQQALRAGKRVHSETGLDRVARSLVHTGLDGAQDIVGDLTDARVLVVGAGSMSALAATTLQRRGVAEITVVNRSIDRASRLAAAVGGHAIPLADTATLTQALAHADIVVSCTGAVGHVVDAALVTAAREVRARIGGGDQLVLDLALPRDVDPEVAGIPGVVLVALSELHERLLTDRVSGEDVRAAREVVAAEVADHLAAQRAVAVAPVVTALRAQAAGVVDAELERLRARLGPDTDPRVVAETAHALHRVVEKLLHTPSVRVKALAASSEAGSYYADALSELFALQDTVDDSRRGSSAQEAAAAGRRAGAATVRGSVDAAATGVATSTPAAVGDVLDAVGGERA